MVGGREGVIGRGALGEVRRGIYREAEVALKRLHLLRTDDAWMDEGGFRLGPEERRCLLGNFMKECELLSTLSHANIVLFVGIVVGARPSPLSPSPLASSLCPRRRLQRLSDVV